MMRPVCRLSILGSMLLLAACSSAPVHFYTLVPPDHAAATAAAAPYRIEVLPVTIPAQVDQPQMVVREGSSSVALLDGERWIAPLGDEIRSALSDVLVRELGTRDVYGLATHGKQPVYRIKVDVGRFESVPNSHTLLAADWSVHATHGKGQALECSSRIREPVEAGYAALADGHQRGVQALAGRIASVVRGMANGAEVRCPQ